MHGFLPPPDVSLAEVRQLLGDVVMAALRELEELREQGGAELAPVGGGDDHARTARLRQDRFRCLPRSSTQRMRFSATYCCK